MLGWHVHSAIFKKDNQQGPTAQTGSSFQCYVEAWMGGQFRGEWYMYMYGWVTLLSIWNYLNVVDQPYSNIKYKAKKKKIKWPSLSNLALRMCWGISIGYTDGKIIVTFFSLPIIYLSIPVYIWSSIFYLYSNYICVHSIYSYVHLQTQG